MKGLEISIRRLVKQPTRRANKYAPHHIKASTELRYGFAMQPRHAFYPPNHGIKGGFHRCRSNFYSDECTDLAGDPWVEDDVDVHATHFHFGAHCVQQIQVPGSERFLVLKGLLCQKRAPFDRLDTREAMAVD
jgi:hypothetical protein